MDAAKRAVRLHAFDTETGEVRGLKPGRVRLLERFAALRGGAAAGDPLGTPAEFGEAMPQGRVLLARDRTYRPDFSNRTA